MADTALVLPLRWQKPAKVIWGRNVEFYDANGSVVLDGVHLTPEAATAIVNAVNGAGEMRAALERSVGYLLNAKIDLETGATKATAIKTIEGGLKMVRAALKTGE